MATVEDSKFTHLLQPIRDLATNWNVNIAEDLDEFLEELEHLTFAFEDGPSLNFAEAALLIQGSACVYSKKVEYLHSLVYRALEFINQKRQQQDAEGRPRQRRQAAHQEVVVLDNEGFLDAEQLIEESNDIDLDPESTPLAVIPVQRPSMLLAFESYGAKRGDGDTGVFMVQRCAVHSSGALLLEPSDGDAYDARLQARQGAPAAPVAPPTQPGNNAMDDMAMDGNWGGAGDVHHDGGDLPMWDHDGGAHDDDDDHDQDADPTAAARHARQAAAQRTIQQPQEPDAPIDPYTMLDMHEAGPWKPRPYVKKQPRRPAPTTGPGPLQLMLTVPPPATGALALTEFAPALRRLQALLRAASKHGKEMVLDVGEEEGDDAVEGGMFGFAEHAGDDSDGEDFGGVDVWDSGVHAGGFEDGWAPPPATDGEQTYEDLCRAHIEAFINAAAAAQVQSDMAVRVSSWQHKIQPLLDEQAARPEFDIHVYGGQLLDRLEELTLEQQAPSRSKKQVDDAQPVPLESAFSSCTTSFDVSRMFSSMLQLVNNGNVLLDSTATSGDGCGVSIKLLQLERAHERFEVEELVPLGGKGVGKSGKSPAKKRGKR